LIRDVGEKEAMRLLQQVMENNAKILELQKQLVILQRKDAEERRREQEREWRRREYRVKCGKRKNRKEEKRKKRKILEW